jgi:hypothetical protein
VGSETISGGKAATQGITARPRHVGKDNNKTEFCEILLQQNPVINSMKMSPTEKKKIYLGMLRETQLLMT